MNLDRLMKKYTETQKISEMDLTLVPNANAAGWAMRKTDAVKELAAVRSQYDAKVKELAFAIFLTGENQWVELFASNAAHEVGTINVGADDFYDKICDTVEPSIGDRGTFGISQLGLLIRALDDLGREMGARNIPIPQIDGVAHTHNRQELRDFVRIIIRKTGVGDQLNAAWIQNETTKKALEIRYNKAVVPVILTGATEDEVATLQTTLFSGTSFVVPVTKENSDLDSVMKCLGEIRKKIKLQRDSQLPPSSSPSNATQLTQ